jgi:hypothetical protein
LRGAEGPDDEATLTLLVAMLVAEGAHASDVFKTTDSKGQPVYDRPATLPAERLDVRTQTTDKVEVQQARRADAELRRGRQGADDAERGRQDASQASELSATARRNAATRLVIATSRT